MAQHSAEYPLDHPPASNSLPAANMEGMVSAAGACVASIVHSCLNQAPRGETLRLSRFASKLGLLITETSLCLRSNEALRGAP